MDSAEIDALYEAVGDRIRKARERQAPKMSQAALAVRLEISRASIVNIEAGRQHAPLSLLWHIAKQLDTELTTLIPNTQDLAPPPADSQLSDDFLAQIRLIYGDEGAAKELTSFVGQAVRQLTTSSNGTRLRKKRK